jgi:hypothetical protein
MTFKFLLCLVWVTLTTAATTSTTSLPGTISTSTITSTSAITTSNSSNYTASGTGFVTTMITTITSTISPDAPASTLDSATVQVGSGTSLTQPFSSTDGQFSLCYLNGANQPIKRFGYDEWSDLYVYGLPGTNKLIEHIS